jgi:uncharacterized integral membrane protein (TIGR00698 family)
MGLQRNMAAGLLLALAAALGVWQLATLPWNHSLQLSALTLAIVLGMAIGNLTPPSMLEGAAPGLRFAQQKVLRLGIILYGVRLTVQDLFRLGPRALLLDIIVISAVLSVGYWLGTRVFGIDRDTALLVSCGAGICGAAAVLATDRVIESESHKVSVAVATVVVFGTVGMFLYPFLYPLTHFSEHTFGVYVGATVHEVAQVVAAARAVGDQAADTAVVTKMLRVVLLAPVLVLIGRVRGSRNTAAAERMAFPWFVVWFAAVIVAVSLIHLQGPVKTNLIDLDTVLLSSAMFALGVNTRWDQLKKAGPRPLMLASTIFIALVGGGYALTSVLVP